MKMLWVRAREAVEVDEGALVDALPDLRAVLVVDLSIEDIPPAVDLTQHDARRDLFADRRRRQMLQIDAIADGLLAWLDVTPHQPNTRTLDELDHRRCRVHRRH